MATLELPYEKVYDLLHKCCTSISPDVLYLMKRAAAKETNPEAKTFLETMLKNVELAGQMDKPVCQSPGFPSVWIRWGEAMQPNLTNLMGNITQSVIEATKPENRGIYTQSDSPKKSSRNIWSLAVVSVDQRY